jgi:hypothetical protein
MAGAHAVCLTGQNLLLDGGIRPDAFVDLKAAASWRPSSSAIEESGKATGP